MALSPNSQGPGATPPHDSDEALQPGFGSILADGGSVDTPRPEGPSGTYTEAGNEIHIRDGLRYEVRHDPDDPFGDEWVPLDHPKGEAHHRLRREPCEVMKKEGIFRKKTKELFEGMGYYVHDAGSWSSFWVNGQQSVRRGDLYGCFDQLAWKGDGLESMAIQFTSKANIGAHITKMCSHIPVSKSDPTWRAQWMRRWLKSGRTIAIVGWFQTGGKGSRWDCEIRCLTLEMMDKLEAKSRVKRS